MGRRKKCPVCGKWTELDELFIDNACNRCCKKAKTKPFDFNKEIQRKVATGGFNNEE